MKRINLKSISERLSDKEMKLAKGGEECPDCDDREPIHGDGWCWGPDTCPYEDCMTPHYCYSDYDCVQRFGQGNYCY